MLGGVTRHMLPHLHGVLCGNSGGFGGDDVTRDNSQRRFLAQHSVATLFRIVSTLFQHCNAMITLKQRRRQRQRELQKRNWFILAKQQLCTCITLFCTFRAVTARQRGENAYFHVS